MASQIISLPIDKPLFTIKATLTGTEYILRFDYNGRQDCWYFGLYDAQQSRIRVGMRVNCGWDVLRTCALDSRPPGQLFFLSGGGQSAPGLSDLGRSTILVYVDAAPIVAVS